MFELLGLFAIVALAVGVVAFLTLGALLLKLVFKVALFPLALAGGVLKAVLAVVGLVIGIAVLPVVLAVGIPVLLVIGTVVACCWAAFAVLAAIF